VIPLRELSGFISEKILEFRTTDFSEVRFETGAWAAGIAGFILCVLILKLFIHRKRNRGRAHSGHAIPADLREGMVPKAARLLAKGIVAIGIVFMLLALAEPHLPKTNKIHVFQTRERVDLIDVSGSMGEPFRQTGKIKASLARKTLLEFLAMRRGQHDRASFWEFSDHPYKLQDFTTDDDAYEFVAEDAPYILYSSCNNSFVSGVPAHFCREIYGEGGTEMDVALDAIIKYFKLEGNPKVKRKSLLIVTDAETSDYPVKEFEEMKANHIVPYIIWLDDGDDDFMAQQVIQGVTAIGGKYYRIQDPGAIRKAFEDINRTEKAETKTVDYLVSPAIFQRFLFVGVILLALGCLLGLIVEVVWGIYS